MGTPNQPTVISSLDLGTNPYANTFFYYGSSGNDGSAWPTVATNFGLLGSDNTQGEYWTNIGAYDSTVPNEFTEYDKILSNVTYWGWFYSGDDNTTLTSDTDFVSMSGGDDTVFVKDDTWTPWGGTDYVFGGAGSDRVALTGSLSDYSLDYVQVDADSTYLSGLSDERYYFTKINKSGKSGSLYLNSIEKYFFVGEQKSYTLSELFPPPKIEGPNNGSGSSYSDKTMYEDSSSVFTFTADQSVTWSLDGGNDENDFSINSSSGLLSFNSTPDYENPVDSDLNNIYQVKVKATASDGNSSTQTITITIQYLDEVNPTITGPSGVAGAASNTLNINENSYSVFTYTANESVTWSLSGGNDSSLFAIDSSSGALTFNDFPDFENPNDHNANNDYEVVIKATDSAGNYTSQNLIVYPLDVVLKLDSSNFLSMLP